MPFAGSQPLPNDHRRKHWTRRIKTCFDQPMKKIRRRRLRAEKKAANPLQPTSLLRPVVRCPTRRYNFRVRRGRGFSLQELKAVGLNKYYAPTVGISVDYRRKNKSVEGLTANVARLREYLSMLVVKSKNVSISAVFSVSEILPAPRSRKDQRECLQGHNPHHTGQVRTSSTCH
ncbi:60S ribosomal protein L13-like [Octopus sinensis]|uniref:60S ribosomal protein L13 n=1 Tax=Octopus sinensis TaxID=2607531 RepID=A0A6P7U4S7_9MOLL|nr:60S ribosomal protein L13-like [Octopus sinensis]